MTAKRATDHTPIVFVAGTNPVVVKLVEFQSQPPGGRLTGVHLQATDLTGKRLELLREIVPGLRRVVTFYNPRNPSAVKSAKQGREAARHLGLEFIERHVASVEELQKVCDQSLETGEADAYISVSDAMIDSQINSIIDMAIAKRLPTMLYEPGGVARRRPRQLTARISMKLAACRQNMFHRIFAGTNPADLPVEQVDRIMFVINAKTAKAIELAIPEVDPHPS